MDVGSEEAVFSVNRWLSVCVGLARLWIGEKMLGARRFLINAGFLGLLALFFSNCEVPFGGSVLNIWHVDNFLYKKQYKSPILKSTFHSKILCTRRLV